MEKKGEIVCIFYSLQKKMKSNTLELIQYERK